MPGVVALLLALVPPITIFVVPIVGMAMGIQFG